MRILFIGDVVGRPGRAAVAELLPPLEDSYCPDLVVANGENAAGGNGITPKTAEELYSSGVDFLTMGNHVWDRKEVLELLTYEERLVRPANFPGDTPGSGYALTTTRSGEKVGVVNLSGRVFLPSLDCPFRSIDRILEQLQQQTKAIIVDFHAEATSEKVAMGWYLDGRVSLVVGTHTHIQTADERILPGGTGYITDVGMTGPRDSVLGVKQELVLTKFLTQRPVRFEVAEGVLQLNAVLVDLDQTSGKTRVIKRIQVYKEDL